MNSSPGRLTIWLAIVLGLMALVLAARSWLGGPEDTWLCRNGVWVRHGQPAAGPPAEPCFK